MFSARDGMTLVSPRHSIVGGGESLLIATQTPMSSAASPWKAFAKGHKTSLNELAVLQSKNWTFTYDISLKMIGKG